MRRKFLWSILIVVVLLVSLFAWLVSTQSGLQTAVSLTQRILPELQIENAEGRLIDFIQLEGIVYKTDDTTVAEVAELTLDWQPAALLKATLLIERLTVNDINLYSAESNQDEAPTEAITLPEVIIPFRVEIAELRVKNLQTISVTNEKTVLVKQLNSALTVQRNILNIHKLQLERDDIALQLEGDLGLQSPYTTDLGYVIDVKQALSSPFQAVGRLEGDIEQLALTQTLSEPLLSKQSATITDVLSDLHWSLKVNADVIDLAAIVPEQQTQLNAFSLKAQGNLTALTADLASTVEHADMPPLTLTAAIESDDFSVWTINSKASVSEQSHVQIAGDINLQDEMPSAELEAVWRNLQWPLAGDNVIGKSANGTVMFSGTAADYVLNVDTALEVEQQQLSVSAQTQGTDSAIQIKQLRVDGFDGNLTADGQLDWQQAPLQYQLNADWQGMKLPASLTTMAVELQQGKIALNGTPEMLSLAAQADLLVDGVAMNVDANASGQIDKGFEQSRVDIALADGKLFYQGQLLWSETLLIDGVLSLDKMNPGVLLADWPGALSGKTQLRVNNQPETGIHVQASDIAIDGTLRERPLKLNGEIDYTKALLTVKQLQLQSGQSLLQANGKMQQDAIAFDWLLKSPDLKDFYPSIAGSLNASGSIGGSKQTPEIKAELSGDNIRYQDIEAQTISGQINLAMSDNADLETHIDVTGLTLPELAIESLSLDLTGKQQKHDITVDVKSEAMTLAIAASGGLNEAIWQGNLTTFNLENTKAGKWTLQQQGELKISATEQHIPQHCWASTNGEFCLAADNSDNGWQTSGQFSALPLSLFEAFAVELEQLQGTLRGDFNAIANKGEAITGEGEIFLDDAELKLEQSALNQQKPIALNNTSLRYQLNADKTQANLHLEPNVDGVSAIDADFETVALAQLLESKGPSAIKGKVTTAIEDLSVLQLSHPAFTDLSGKFDLNLAISGTTSQPQIQGKASLSDGQVAIVDAGIVLEQIEANINGNLNQVAFDYQATSGQGALNGDGTFTLNDADWALNTALKAQQFTVMNTPEALVIAEPDLTILVTPKLTKVTGRVVIPEAELEPTQFNSTVSPSRDVVIISDEPVAEQTGPSTELDIKIILGDKVKLKAMGFQGRLAGDLRVSGNTNDILLGNGEIKIIDGSYLAYGQLLKVDDGSIRFAGGAIDNPELDIKAVRVGKDYKAGLHIEGYASSPQANLFSEPNMTQDNILSYILLGKPLEQASATDAAILASAASGLGLQNGAMMGDQIASTFGLDEFSVQGDSADNAALQVGKYLSPKIYLSYGIGVFDSVSTVELRYQLSKIWSLKAESGTESGVDLLYSYERGVPE
ncbi:hypothetical protein LP43_1334 [Methylophaga thiooxydans]|uniref:Translocation and assembly module TamB C-terminal domain-containing protein n=1 Tax=Methylophaga thiooxydans TaxID=392484 RepID=A0A0A0BGP1_9GAMM|nr:translocation/assembly module TamB domain-containing protein [Methylophaga thiooxydans]KGM06842.1 hypothetical protein LP43_1334 [Methylophaga thiooxydans]